MRKQDKQNRKNPQHRFSLTNNISALSSKINPNCTYTCNNTNISTNGNDNIFTHSNSKGSLRMSIPCRSRRESIGIGSIFGDNMGVSVNGTRDSFNLPLRDRDIRTSFNSTKSIQIPSSLGPSKKQNILTNLIKKLDDEQQLKQIIQSKIKSTKCYEMSRCSMQNNQHSNLILQQKLKKCQQQLEYFKQMVKNLMYKIQETEKQESQFKQVQKRNRKKLAEIATQTENIVEASSPQKGSGVASYESSKEYLQNLQKTLKILSGKKTH